MKLNNGIFILTDTQKKNHPTESPVSNLPVRITPRKALWLLVMREDKQIINQPINAGMPPIMRASFRPKDAERGQAIRLPSIAPVETRACYIPLYMNVP